LQEVFIFYFLLLKEYSFVSFSVAPNDAPGGLALHGFNTSCVTVSWDTSPSRPNGEITSYSVSYTNTCQEIFCNFMLSFCMSGRTWCFKL